VIGEVYADVFFLVNFSMDFLCFYLCARLLHRPLSLWRGMLASALGGIYAVAALFLALDRAPAFALDALVCVVLCAVAMGARREGLRALFRLSGLYLLVSMVLGGVMTALYAQLNRIPGVTDRVEADGASAWVFFGIAMLSALLSTLWGRSFRRETAKTRVTVVVVEGGRRVELGGIVDSGNLLHDPISGKPVIVADSDQLAGAAPSALLRVAAAERVSEAVTELPGDMSRRVRLIPARGATGERLMVAWSPEHVYLKKDERSEREVGALIAPSKLSGRRSGANIAALVPSELIS
jgi:stage II sporulation protein GA (sporulation sigma-E factor processing peptidase)